MSVSSGYRGTTKRQVNRDPESGFFAFVWRHRVGLGPVLYGMAAYVLALVLRYIVKIDMQWYLIIAGVATLVAVLFITFTTSDREGEWHAHRNQIYLYLVTIATGVWGWWSLTLPYTMESYKLTNNVFVVLLLLGAIPYWFDLRRRTRVSLDNKLERWPIMTEGTRFVGSRVSGFRKKEFGWKMRLWVPPGRSSREIIQATEFIEQAFDE